MSDTKTNRAAAGYYWVKVCGEWCVAYYEPKYNFWVLPGFSDEFYEENLEEVLETRIVLPVNDEKSNGMKHPLFRK